MQGMSAYLGSSCAVAMYRSHRTRDGARRSPLLRPHELPVSVSPVPWTEVMAGVTRLGDRLGSTREPHCDNWQASDRQVNLCKPTACNRLGHGRRGEPVGAVTSLSTTSLPATSPTAFKSSVHRPDGERRKRNVGRNHHVRFSSTRRGSTCPRSTCACVVRRGRQTGSSSVSRAAWRRVGGPKTGRPSAFGPPLPPRVCGAKIRG